MTGQMLNPDSLDPLPVSSRSVAATRVQSVGMSGSSDQPTDVVVTTPMAGTLPAMVHSSQGEVEESSAMGSRSRLWVLVAGVVIFAASMLLWMFMRR
jgi:hypothetical protein